MSRVVAKYFKWILYVQFLQISVFSNVFANQAAGSAPDKIYRVRIPAMSRTCVEEANLLSQHFLQATGVSPTKAECTDTAAYPADGKNYFVFVLTIFYSSEAQVSLTSSVYGFNGLPIGDNGGLGDYYGMYDSYSSCVDHLQSRVQEYEKYTGLKAIDSFCTRARVSDTYVVQVDGFGKPQQKLSTFDSGFGSSPTSSELDELLQFARQQGASVVDQFQSRIFYYSHESLNFRAFRFFSYQTPEICSAQIDEARRILNQMQLPSIIRCSHTSKEEIDTETLLAISVGYGYPLERDVTEKYFSLSECLADRERILKNATYYDGQAPYGAICSSDALSKNNGIQFKMKVYKRGY